MPYMDIGRINSVITVFRQRQSLSVRGCMGWSTGVSAKWGPQPYIARVWGTSGLQSICELTFCAASCTTRHLVSFDKSYRPGFLHAFVNSNYAKV